MSLRTLALKSDKQT
jgi:hypothetical protein